MARWAQLRGRSAGRAASSRSGRSRPAPPSAVAATPRLDLRIARMVLPQALRPAAWRGYWSTAALAAGNPLSDGPLFLIDYVIRIMRVVLLVSIWRTVLPAGEQVSGMTLGAVMAYTLVAAAFAPLLDVRTQLVWTIWNGSVVS